MNYRSILVAICLLLSATAYSDGSLPLPEAESSAPKMPQSSNKFSYSLALDFISFDSTIAAGRGLSDSATALQLAGVYNFTQYFFTSVGFGFFNLEDDNQFSQIVVDDEGFVRVLESKTDGRMVFGEMYFQNIPKSSGGTLYKIGVGAAQIYGVSREISNCGRCDSAEFDMRGGAYGLVSLGTVFDGGSSIGLTARAYLDGDVEHSVLLWWQSR